MELMIFAIDALPPDILEDNIDYYPNIKKLIDTGVFSKYDTYTYGYGSSDNWISIYTGVKPEEHGSICNKFKDEKRAPNSNDYRQFNPFWNELNKKGLKVGMWRGLVTTPPLDIDGYMVSGEVGYELENKDIYKSINPILNDKDSWILDELEGELEKNIVPDKIRDYIEDCDKKEFEEKISNLLKEDYFIEAYYFLKRELEYYKRNIIKIQSMDPVDICFYYNTFIDYIGHFQYHDPNKKVVKKAIKLVDNFIGDIIEELKPKNVIVISDHGLKGWHEHFIGYDKEKQKELFGLSDNAYWLNNGTIIIEGRNGGAVSACHDIKGTFIASGEKFKNKKIKEMRTLDVYPTLLEMFDIKLKEHREGKVVDIFKKDKVVNNDILLIEENLSYKNIIVIQNISIPKFNSVLNKVFLRNRFYKIDVLGEEKYRKALEINTRVNRFIDCSSVKGNEILSQYDKVIIPYYNDKTNVLDYYEL